MAGVSRSVTLVIAYIMEKSKISYESAYSYVKAKRNIVYNFINLFRFIPINHL